MAKRRTLHPMPIAPLLDHPQFIAMANGGAGAAFRLTAHYWLTDCRPLPQSDGELCALARANRATWKEHNASIRAILADVLPELDRAKHNRQARGSNLIAAQYASIAARRAAKLAQSQTHVDQPGLTPFVPRKEPKTAPRLINTSQTRIRD